jgi:mannose-6-phosphate isomerase-like protein (cupin superfamily)
VQKKQLRLTKGFRVGIGNKRAQMAEMVIPPGEAEGGPGNEHHGADQWLLILEGTGVAKVEGKRVPLKAGTLLLIERGEEHEVKNTGRRLLRTLNIYVPPAFRKSGARLPRGK